VAFNWNGEKQDHHDIYIKPIGPGPARKLTSNPFSSGNPRWSPDGNWIAFERNNSILLVSPEGGPERKLAEGALGSWTPDGKALAVTRNGSANSPDSIGLISAEPGEFLWPLSSPPDDRSDNRPQISPDGKKLAFYRRLFRGGFKVNTAADIFIANLKNGKPEGEAWQLTNYNNYISGMAWTPDSREILITCARSGRRCIWRIAVSPGAEAQQIPGTDEAAAIACAAGRPGHF
jgi:Tol biopolymer transport system component